MIDAGRLLAVARKEAIQLRRDRRSLALAFLVPLLMLVFFGYAITWDVDDIPLAVVNEDAGGRGEEMVDAFTASGYFVVADRPPGRASAEAQLVRGQATAVLVVPPDFSRRMGAGGPAPVQLLLDGADANTATIALNYAEAIAARWSAAALLEGRALTLPAEAESRVWYNPTLSSRHMIVPGLIAVIMSIIAAMLTALTIAREWERGTMEQLASTPVHRLEVVLGKLLPYVLIGLLDVAVAVIVGVTLFGVPLRGSVLLLAALTLLFLVGALGLGLFISAAVKSQVLATQVAMVATYLPALLLSGFLFDIASMPPALQAITLAIPARYYMVVTRGIFLKDVGLQVLWVQGVAMLLFATVGLGLATLAFRKRIAP